MKKKKKKKNRKAIKYEVTLKKDDRIESIQEVITTNLFTSEEESLEYIEQRMAEEYEKVPAEVKEKQLKEIFDPESIPALKKALDETPSGKVVAFFRNGVTYFFEKK